MKLINKNESGWEIGKWCTPISIRYFKTKILRWYGIRFDNKYNTICFGKIEIRIWKPNFLRNGNGIYYFKEIPYNRNNSL